MQRVNLLQVSESMWKKKNNSFGGVVCSRFAAMPSNTNETNQWSQWSRLYPTAVAARASASCGSCCGSCLPRFQPQTAWVGLCKLLRCGLKFTPCCDSWQYLQVALGYAGPFEPEILLARWLVGLITVLEHWQIMSSNFPRQLNFLATKPALRGAGIAYHCMLHWTWPHKDITFSPGFSDLLNCGAMFDTDWNLISKLSWTHVFGSRSCYHVFFLMRGSRVWPMVSWGIPLHGTSSSRETPRGNNHFVQKLIVTAKKCSFCGSVVTDCGKSSVVNDAVQRRLHVSLAVSSSKIRCNKVILDSVCMVDLFFIYMIRGSHFDATFGGMALATLGIAWAWDLYQLCHRSCFDIYFNHAFGCFRRRTFETLKLSALPLCRFASGFCASTYHETHVSALVLSEVAVRRQQRLGTAVRAVTEVAQARQGIQDFHILLLHCIATAPPR